MRVKTALKMIGIAATLLVGMAGLVATFRVGVGPVVDIRPERAAIGPRTPIVVSVAAPGRGLGSVRVELVQGDQVYAVAERGHRPLPAWAPGGERVERDEIRAEIGVESFPDLRTGEARVRVTATRAGTWLLRPPPVVTELTLPVRLVPPELTVLSVQHYVSQGGAGVVVYRAGETSVRDGVRAGSWFFPGSPLEGSESGGRFALFGVPWDSSDDSEIRLLAEDDVGNRVERPFVDRFFPKLPARDRIRLDDAFMGRVVPEILRRTPDLPAPGSLLERYLQINRDLRRRNAEALVELARNSTPRFLWGESFLPLRNAQVMSSFADHRTYLYEGREVDEQVHLGYDLAVVARTPVPSANRGIVRMARYLGIYGNTVVVDHGHGLMTLYAHLSSMDIQEGQEVERGAILGRTGATGLAGGDHLHFTTLVGGLPVNPTEWWDAAWIRERVARKLGGTLPFTEPTGEGS